MISRVGCVVLAAGEGRRYSPERHKLLTLFEGKLLLQRAIDAASTSRAMSSTLVVGAHAQRLLDMVDTRRCAVAINSQWPEGIASSVRSGLANHLADEACIFMVADQPFVSAADLDQIIALHLADREAIVALKSQEIWGTPMLFPRRFYKALMQLRGDAGAKRLAQRHPGRLHFAAALSPFAFVDVDTLADMKRLDQMEPRT